MVEEIAIAYPHLDKFQINLILDFDEQMVKKYGPDYDAEELADEIFPGDEVTEQLVTVSVPSDDGKGADSETGAELLCKSDLAE